MSAQAIADLLQRESGRIGTDIYKLNFGTSPINDLTIKDTWPDYMGQSISVITYERNAPTDAVPSWYDWTVIDGEEGGACLTPAEKVTYGSTLRSYGLKRRVLEGEPFCVENIRFSLALADQLAAVTEILAERVRIEWELINKYDYDRLVKRKVTAVAAGVVEDNTGLEGWTGALAVAPTMLLSQGLLDQLKVKLLRDGAAKDAMGMVDGSPILTLMCDQETSDGLLFQSGETGGRQDLRWGNPSALLKSFGVEKQYKGFFHIIDSYPRRFILTAGAFVEIPAFVNSAASKGTKSDVNPAWESIVTAPFTISRIYSRNVFHRMFPAPISNPGSNFKFDPVMYNGEWKMLNILHRTENPDGTILTPRGILGAGAKPIYPNRGVSIMHMRCQAPLNAVTACP